MIPEYLVIAALLAAAIPLDARVPAGTAPATFDPFDLVGICAIPSAGRTWSLVWHPGATGADPKSMRVFRHLEAPDFDECLVSMIESDDKTRDAAEAYGNEPTEENARRAAQASRRRWSTFGVDRAIAEVAVGGARGLAVQEVLAACEEIKNPRPTLGTP